MSNPAGGRGARPRAAAATPAAGARRAAPGSSSAWTKAPPRLRSANGATTSRPVRCNPFAQKEGRTAALTGAFAGLWAGVIKGEVYNYPGHDDAAPISTSQVARAHGYTVRFPPENTLPLAHVSIMRLTFVGCVCSSLRTPAAVTSWAVRRRGTWRSWCSATTGTRRIPSTHSWYAHARAQTPFALKTPGAFLRTRGPSGLKAEGAPCLLTSGGHLRARGPSVLEAELSGVHVSGAEP